MAIYIEYPIPLETFVDIVERLHHTSLLHIADVTVRDGQVHDKVPAEVEYVRDLWTGDFIDGMGIVRSVENYAVEGMHRINMESGRTLLMGGDMQVLVRKFVDAESGEPLPIETVLIDDTYYAVDDLDRPEPEDDDSADDGDTPDGMTFG